MGGQANLTLSTGWKGEDNHYYKTRAKMKWYLPLLREYLEKASKLLLMMSAITLCGLF